MHIPAVMIQIAKIRRDSSCQPRVVLDEVTVAEYAEAMKDNAEFPPVTLYFDDEDYWLADGFHRCAAAETCGRQTVPADVRDGNRRNAILHSVGVNADHGLRRGNDDKRRAIMTLLEDEEWSKWSDSEIARRCAVDPKTVATHRKSILGNSKDSGWRKVSRYGNTYDMDVSKVGRRAAAPGATAKTTKASTPAATNAEPSVNNSTLGIEPPPSDDSDQQLGDLLRAWNSASEEVRGRFLDQIGIVPMGGSAAPEPERATEGDSGLVAVSDCPENPLLPIWLDLKPNTKLRGRQWVELGCPDAPRPDEAINITEALETFRAIARASSPEQRERFLEVTPQSQAA